MDNKNIALKKYCFHWWIYPYPFDIFPKNVIKYLFLYSQIEYINSGKSTPRQHQHPLSFQSILICHAWFQARIPFNGWRNAVAGSLHYCHLFLASFLITNPFYLMCAECVTISSSVFLKPITINQLWLSKITKQKVLLWDIYWSGKNALM